MLAHVELSGVRLRSGDSNGPTTADAASNGPLGTLTPLIAVNA